MAIRLNPNPTFRAKVTIPDPDGPGFELDCEFKHKGKAEFEAFTTSSMKSTDLEQIKALLVKWHDPDTPYSEESLAVLLDSYPGAAIAISRKYGQALYEGRKGN